MKLELRIEVEYELNGTAYEQLASQLEDAAAFLFMEGMLTGEYDAEVEEWTAYVVRVEE